MRRFIIWITLLMTLLLLFGCKPVLEGSRYLQSLMDTLYKASYTDYAELTGTTTAEVSVMRDTWMEGQTDRFLKAFHAGNVSADMRKRATAFLNNAYANLDYTVSEDENGYYITLRPLLLVTDNYEALAQYRKTFNEKNKKYDYADLDSTAYADAYMDGLMTILEQGLSSIPQGKAVKTAIPVEKGEDGLYAPDEVTIKKLQITAFPLAAPEAEK